MMTNQGNRVTQGQFSFLPDLTDNQITAQMAMQPPTMISILDEAIATDNPHFG